MFNGAEADRLAIRELIDGYSDAVIRRDRSRWASAWHTHAVWRFSGRVVEGREEIVALWEKAMAGYKAVFFAAFPGFIAVDGDAAKVCTHTFEHLTLVDGTNRFQAGLYDDRAMRTDAGWKFIERTFVSRELTL